jgi:hypothetical protein
MAGSLILPDSMPKAHRRWQLHAGSHGGGTNIVVSAGAFPM